MSPPVTPRRSSALSTLPVFAVSRLGRIANEKVRVAFSREDLSWRGHFLLVCLNDGELSQRELADLTSLDPSDLVKVVDILEAANLVRRHPDPRDRRRHMLYMTDDGKDAYRRGEQLIDALTKELLAPLDADQQALLLELVTAVVDAHTSETDRQRSRPR